MLLKGGFPAVETGPLDTELPAGAADMRRLLGMPQKLQHALNFVVVLGHRRHPPRPIGL